MAAKAPETGKAPEGAKADGAATADPSPKGGGLAAWLPLIVATLLMPVAAWATTTFLLIPKLKEASGGAGHAKAAPAEKEAAAPAQEKEKEKEAEPARGKEKEKEKESESAGKGEGAADALGKGKSVAELDKLVVNLAGSLGTRYLMVKMTLVGSKGDLKKSVDANVAQMKDLANSVLSSKSISDLEKPAARNSLRSELITVFNSALGSGVVQNIYFTEFVVQ